MSHLRISVLVIMLAMALSGCTMESSDSDEYGVVTYKERKIDLKPYFEGFPYSGFKYSFDAGKIFYYKTGETTTLHQIDLGDNLDLEKGQIISDIDFSKRNVWHLRYNKEDKLLYWYGDEKNDEVMNIYRLSPETKEVKKLTDVPYIFDWNFSKDKKNIAYIARLGVMENRLGELRLIDLKTLKEKTICQDSPELRYTWGSPVWNPDGSGLVLPALKNADRNYCNLLYIDFKTGSSTLLTDSSRSAKEVDIFGKWYDNEHFLYLSNVDGYKNIYKCNYKSGQTTQLTAEKTDISEITLMEHDGNTYIVYLKSTPVESRITVISPETGEVIYSRPAELHMSILDLEDNKVVVTGNNATNKFRMDMLSFDGKEIKSDVILDIPEELKKKIYNCTVERYEIPTFDIDLNTGKQRTIHAYLFRPKKEMISEYRVVAIQAFYGGWDKFINRTQILTEAGIYVVSPSPRGSSGFGAEFSALNDGDLGGNEIVDIIYLGKYFQKVLGVHPDRIGVFGGSHGGYSVMRLLTFPGQVNGLKAQFDWGWGISHAGFSDILHFYKHCNIPDWVKLEAGDPVTERQKLIDRSPLYHAKDMMGKLLMLHGSNDMRVPVEGSRFFADSLKKYGKNYILVEFEGQGHGIKGLDNNIKYFKAWFEFLDKVKTEYHPMKKQRVLR